MNPPTLVSENTFVEQTENTLFTHDPNVITRLAKEGDVIVTNPRADDLQCKAIANRVNGI